MKGDSATASQLQPATQEGWSVLVQGAVHFVDSEDELASIAHLGVQARPGVPRSSSSVSSPGTSPAGASGGFRAGLENDGLGTTAPD